MRALLQAVVTQRGFSEMNTDHSRTEEYAHPAVGKTVIRKNGEKDIVQKVVKYRAQRHATQPLSVCRNRLIYFLVCVR